MVCAAARQRDVVDQEAVAQHVAKALRAAAGLLLNIARYQEGTFSTRTTTTQAATQPTIATGRGCGA